ncbi:MAG: hypothetical protein ABFS34_02070 [Gemmatimonadota bacterium]
MVERTKARLEVGVVAVLFGLLVGACGGDDGGFDPPPPAAGDGVAFNYSGDRAGTFEAAGNPAIANGQIAPGTWAAALSTDTGFVLVGSRSASLPLVDLFFLTVPSPVLGGSTDFGGVAGGVGVVAFDFDASVGLDPDSILAAINPTDVYVMSEGVLTLNTLSSSRATGTVVASGPRFDAGPRLFVESGSFDVPVVDGAVLGVVAARLALEARDRVQ